MKWLQWSKVYLFEKIQSHKVLEDQFRRDKDLSIELIGGLLELLGMNCQLGEVDPKYFSSVEDHAVFFLEGIPVILFAQKGETIYLGHPHKGLEQIPLNDIESLPCEKLRFISPRRVASTPTSRFGWSWFTPLLKKYKKSLILVFIASLLAQLFGLAILCLFNKLLISFNTGKLSSLNVLGTLMVVLALFQGILMALRTYIFVDTTDRMDLTLGTAVIDRLLALPPGYFDKRPVGELSQR